VATVCPYPDALTAITCVADPTPTRRVTSNGGAGAAGGRAAVVAGAGVEGATRAADGTVVGAVVATGSGTVVCAVVGTAVVEVVEWRSARCRGPAS